MTRIKGHSSQIGENFVTDPVFYEEREMVKRVDSRRKYHSVIIYDCGGSSILQVVRESRKRQKTIIGRPLGSKSKMLGRTVPEDENRSIFQWMPIEALIFAKCLVLQSK